LHHSGCFSPFADYSIYTTDSGSSATSISVQYESTGLASSDFAALSLDDSSLFGGTFTDKDFFDDSYSVIQLYTIEDDDDIERFPLAKTNPSVYFSTKIQTDLEISVETTTSVDELIIGSDATGSSIKVYRNGIKENSFIYNQDEGTVTLSPPPSSFDSIYITWSEYSESSDTALFTVAAGYEKQVSKYFSYNISASLFYPINDDNDFATLESTTPFSTSLAFNTTITTPSITLENTICGTLQQTNLSGKLRVFGMSDDEPVTLYFDSDPTIDDSSQNMSASTSRSDSDSTYQLELEWTLDSTDDSAYQAFEFYSSSDCLATTDEFTITIDGLSEANIQDCTVYLQLGVDDDGDATSLTPEWELSSDNEDDDYDDSDYDYSEDTGSITVTLTDSDRSLIGDNTAVRIVVEKTDSNSTSGTLTISDCYATQCAFGVNSPDYYTTTLSSEDTSPSDIDEPSAMTLFSDDDDTNYVQKLTWKSSLSSGETISAFTATGYTDSIPLAEYGELHFFAYFDPDDSDDSDDDYAITINLTRPETDETETAFCLTLLPDAVSQLTTSWHEIALNMVSKELTIDDDTIDSSDYTVSVDTDISPTCLTIEILPSESDGSAYTYSSDDATDGTVSKNGEFYIDELYLSETELEKKLIDYFDFTWAQQNAVTFSNGFVCITDSSVKVDAEGVLSSPDQYSDEVTTLLQTTTQAQTSIPFFTIAGLTNSEATADSSEDKFRLTGLGYTIKTNKLNFEKSPLAKLLSASDSTTVSANNSYFTGTRSSQASLDFTDFLLPVSLTATSSVESDEESAIQAAEATMIIKSIFSWAPSLHLEGTAYQKLDSNICSDQSDADTLSIDEFDSSWINLSEFQYSIGDDSASKKKLQLSASSTLDLPWYSISPDLTCTASSTDTDDENSSSNKIELSFPVTINQQHFSTSFESKYVTVTTSDTEGTYATNVYSWQTAIESQSEYWLNNPFSNLFSQTLSQDLIDICSDYTDIETVTTTGSAGLSWKRPIFASFYDFIVPSSASLSFERDTQASDSDYTDTYQTKISIVGTAFDCFGSKGSHPIFSWYEQDEFMNSVSTTFRYGSSERIAVETYSTASFSINSKDYLSGTLNTSIDTDDSTTIQIQGSYTWYKDTCIISDIFLHFMPRFSNLSHSAKRDEYILYEYDNDSDDISQNLTISHKLTASLTDVFSAYTKFENELAIDEDSFSLSNTVSIGVKMEF
jgi:DNA polymerase-4